MEQSAPFEEGTEGIPPMPKTSKEVTKGHPMIIYNVAICATIGGLLFGYDTGIINGALLLLEESFEMSTMYKQSIVASTVASAAVFSLFAGVTADGIGRKPTIMIAALTFILGGLVMGGATSKAMILVGRIVVGSSIGFVSTIVPVYVSECAPSDIRGRLITMNQLFITIGILLSAILAGALQSLDEMGWRLMLGLAVVPGVIQFVMFICLPESPRYIMMKGKEQKCEQVLQKIRASDNVKAELNEIKETLQVDKDTKGFAVLSRMFSTPHVRKALFIGCMLQFFQQFCGINTVIYYSSTILQEAGFSKDLAIWLSTIPFTVNFLATFIGLWAVETLGRRLVLAASFFAIALSLFVLALSFYLAESSSPAASALLEKPGILKDRCFTYSTCHECVADDKCGYCVYSADNDHKVKDGSCVTITNKSHVPAGRCHGDPDALPEGLHLRHICPSEHAWISVAGLILYVLFFAPGAGPMPWTINAEIYPMWCRGMGNSLATVTNWTCNMFVSFTFLTLIDALSPVGTFLMFSVVCIAGGIFVMALVPETKDKSLEEVEKLFMSKKAQQYAPGPPDGPGPSLQPLEEQTSPNPALTNVTQSVQGTMASSRSGRPGSHMT